ncbi:MAG: DNA primase DnaG [Nanoarchaeota archaeon]
MAKISPVSIKYNITANFTAEGRLEKPDVIGAIFGQTEGLLGSALEMRELQKEGKIGRIDVDLKYEDSKTIGKIVIPSALDKAETTIIGAAIETIERIGPSDAKIEIEKIDDVRGNKREYILERAKKLLEQFQGNVPESRDMSDSIKESVKVAKMTEYGEEKLPAGDVSGTELIIVEGRADVVNLVKNNVLNVIGMNGTKLPAEVITLSKEKEVILFVDGDRGGQLIIKNVVDNANVDFICVAPDGKEVEELTGKEILQALRKKIPMEEYMKDMERNESRPRRSYRRNDDDRDGDGRSYGRSRSSPYSRDRDSYYDDRYSSSRDNSNDAPSAPPIEKRDLNESEMKKIKDLAVQIDGQRTAYFLSDKLGIIADSPTTYVSGKLSRMREPVFAMVVDGLVSPSMISAAERKGIHHIAAKNFAATDTKINLVSV